MARKVPCLSFLLSILVTIAMGQERPTKADSYYFFLKGTQLRAEGQLEEAEGAYLKAIQGSENPSYIYSTLAEVYFEMWRWDKSEKAAGKALSLNPENIPAHNILAKIYLARAASENKQEVRDRSAALRAKDEFLKIIALDPDNRDAYYSLGKITYSLSQFEESERYFSRYTELNPFSDTGYMNLGELKIELGKLTEAQKSLEKALSINSNNYKGYLLLGRAYELDSLHDQAASLYEEALKHFPQDILFLNRLGFSLYILRNYEKALVALNDVFQVDPSNAQAFLTKAKILHETGRDGDAEHTYRRLIEEDKSNLEARLEFAFFLEDKRDYEGAISEYEAVLGKDKNPPVERAFFYNFRLGILYERSGKFLEAENYLRKSIELNPKSGEALNYLGYMLVERGRNLEEAVELIKRALVMDSENGAYLDSLGWAYFRLKNYEKAEIYLKKAILKLEDDPVINDHLGDLYLMFNKKEKALAYWEKALKNNIEDKDRVKKKIERLLRE